MRDDELADALLQEITKGPRKKPAEAPPPLPPERPPPVEPSPPVRDLLDPTDRDEIEELRREMRALLPTLPAAEAREWATRLEALRDRAKSGRDAFRDELQRLRRDLEARRMEAEFREKVAPPAELPPPVPEPIPRYVLVLDRQGQVLASRGDHTAEAYHALAKTLQLAVPKLPEGPHVLSHREGQIGLVIGDRGAVAAAFPHRPPEATMTTLVRVLSVLEKKHGAALTDRTTENQALVDGYAEACLRLLTKTA